MGHCLGRRGWAQYPFDRLYGIVYFEGKHWQPFVRDMTISGVCQAHGLYCNRPLWARLAHCAHWLGVSVLPDYRHLGASVTK